MNKKNMILFAIGAVIAYIYVTRKKVTLTVDSFDNNVPDIIDVSPGGYTASAVAGVRG